MFKKSEIQTAIITTSKKGDEMMVIDHLVDNVGLVKQFILLNKTYSLTTLNSIQRKLNIKETSIEDIELAEFRGLECCVFLDKQINGRFTNYFVKFITEDATTEETGEDDTEVKKYKEVEVKVKAEEVKVETKKDSKVVSINTKRELKEDKEYNLDVDDDFELNLFSLSNRKR